MILIVLGELGGHLLPSMLVVRGGSYTTLDNPVSAENVLPTAIPAMIVIRGLDVDFVENPIIEPGNVKDGRCVTFVKSQGIWLSNVNSIRQLKL